MPPRVPRGSGTGAAAQHSQSLEAWFAHVPGLTVMPATGRRRRGPVARLIDDPDPVIVLEHKLLHRVDMQVEAPVEGVPARLVAEPEGVVTVGEPIAITAGTDDLLDGPSPPAAPPPPPPADPPPADSPPAAPPPADPAPADSPPAAPPPADGDVPLSSITAERRSNLGGMGVESFTALLTPPQATALSLGAVEPRVVAVPGAVVARLRCRVGLSVDHRVADGADAARLLERLRRRCADPALLRRPARRW